MMPDLGAYSGAVLGAFGISLALMAGIVLLSLWRSRRIESRLNEVESRRRDA